jgi:signal transduction histidine kinase
MTDNRDPSDSEARFSLLMDRFPGFAFIKDDEGRFVYANQLTREFLEAHGGMTGETDYHRWPPDLSAGVVADDHTVRTTGETVERVEQVPLPAGTRSFLTLKFPIPREGRPPLVGAVSQDITELMETQKELATNRERLRALVAELAVTEEQERHRLADVIHDNLGQTLAVAKLKTQMLSRDAGTEALKTELDSVQALLDEAIANTRSVTFELSPPVLYQVGFEAAVVWLGQQTQERHKIAVHLENDDLPKPLTDEGRSILFQVVRELFANVIKHAQAQNVWVRLRTESGMLVMEVEDDGVGFDPAQATWTAKHAAGFGLFSIRERIEYLHGKVEIESTMGGGTRAKMTVPLAVQS